MRSYLSTEANFAVLKDLQSRNLVVPVVGNFGGPKAIRAIAQYLKSRGATVAAFYLSNVEQYLQQDGLWTDVLPERGDDAAGWREHVHAGRRAAAVADAAADSSTISARWPPKHDLPCKVAPVLLFVAVT
jgi:hypothetical protein